MKIILSPAKKMNNDEPWGTFGQEVFGRGTGTGAKTEGNYGAGVAAKTEDSCGAGDGVKTEIFCESGAGFVTRPEFLEKAEVILSWLRERSYGELKALWKCNDKLAEENFERIAKMDIYSCLTPAILSYEGIAYQYMAPSVFETSQYDYVQEHLRILSAFYGVLRPMDGVTPYRLEMGAKAAIGNTKNLYDFWGKALYDAVLDESRVIINLASREYSRCVEKYLTPADRYITITFVERAKESGEQEAEKEQAEGKLVPKDGTEGKFSEGKLVSKEKPEGKRMKEKLAQEKLVTKGTYAKMARGEMVRFMAENRIEVPEDLQSFDRLGYVFRADLSDEKEYVFERKGKA